jgi:hypothetical protein
VQISLLPAMLETRAEVFSGGRCFFEVGTDRRFELVELAGHRSSEIWLDVLLTLREPLFLITLEVLLLSP